MFPYVSMAQKRIEGIGWGQLIERASRFLRLSPSFPGLPAKLLKRVSRAASSSGKCLWCSFWGLRAMTAVNKKFPRCFQDVSMAKKKINDDTLLQLIRDGNSPPEGIRKSLEVVELEQRISALEERAKPRSR